MQRIGRPVAPVAVLVTALIVAAWVLTACSSRPAAPAAPVAPIASIAAPNPSRSVVPRPRPMPGIERAAGPDWRVLLPIGLLVAGLAVGAVIAAVAYANRRRPVMTPPAPAPGWPAGPTLDSALREVAASGASQAVTQQIQRLLAEGPGREALVQACVRYRDLLADRYPQLAGTLAAALAASGVRETHADGQPFDGRLHEAVDVAPTADPRLHDRVARTVRCGYVDGDRILRVPTVVVYRLSQETGT
ncbi:nucleotide exchange factor GrpE [Streptosporangiaceae bacterium NEAU-GS5]|nr:nucleotide exchange factor GrpE [Streptosporangiaceae bacterium NEAU-GS5]